MPEAADGGLGIGALGPISPSITTESLYFSPKVFSSARASSALPSRRRPSAAAMHDAQADGIELDGAAILGLGRRLVARHLVDLRLDHQDRRLGALALGGLQLGKSGARARRNPSAPALQPGQHEVAQRTELVLRADAAELLLGGAIVALLDLLDGQHEVGEPVARLASPAPAARAARRRRCGRHRVRSRKVA